VSTEAHRASKARRRWPNLDVHDVKQQKSSRSHARAGSRRAQARRSKLFEYAQPRSRMRAFDRFGLSDLRVLRAHRVPPACWRRVFLPAAG